MFGVLKDKIGNGAIDKAVEKFAPSLSEHLENIKTLKPVDVNDDEKFDSLVIGPMLMSISGSSGGVTNLIPKFDDRFKEAMFHVRNELILVEGDTVSIVEDAQSKLPTALVDGFKKSA